MTVVRLPQVAEEVLRQNTSVKVVDSQTVVEVLRQQHVLIRLSSCVVEVLRPNVMSGRPQIFVST